MMTPRQKIIRVLQIAEEVDPSGFVAAEHDELFVADEGAKFSIEQEAALGALGCTKGDTGWSLFT